MLMLGCKRLRSTSGLLQLAIMEEATKLRESATDVAEAMAEIEGYMQRLKDISVEVCPRELYRLSHWVAFGISNTILGC